jgi:hypothetical protein
LLIKQLERAADTNEYTAVIAKAEKVSELSLSLLLQAFSRLGDDLPEKEDFANQIDRASAYKKMFTIIPPILKAKEFKDLSVPYLSGMLRAVYKCPESIRDQGDHAKLVTRFLADISSLFAERLKAGEDYEANDLKLILRMPFIDQSAEYLGKQSIPRVKEMSMDQLADMMATANNGDCPELGKTAFDLALKALDISDVTAEGPRRVLFEAVRMKLKVDKVIELATDAWAPNTEAAGPSLVDFLIAAAAVVDGGADGEQLKPIFETLLESDLEALPITVVTELAVLGTKSAAIAPILERLDVGRVVTLALDDACKLLLALSKAKGPPKIDKAFGTLGKHLEQEVGAMSVPQLLKVLIGVKTVSPCRKLFEAAADTGEFALAYNGLV